MSKRTNATSVAELAIEMAGNFEKFNSFYCSDFNDIPREYRKNYAIYYTGGRDADLLTQSNEQYIKKAMKKYLNGKVAWETSHNHWAVGYLDGIGIQVYTRAGKITRAFECLAEILLRINNYPILDEDDFCRRESEAWSENVIDEIRGWFSENDIAHWNTVPKDEEEKYLNTLYCEFTTKHNDCEVLGDGMTMKDTEKLHSFLDDLYTPELTVEAGGSIGDIKVRDSVVGHYYNYPGRWWTVRFHDRDEKTFDTWEEADKYIVEVANTINP
jgi:hypothetical protein